MRAAAADTKARLWAGVVMPDHVHLLVSALVGKSPLDTGSDFKRLVTLALRELGHAGPVWQRRIHDRGIRTQFGGEVSAAAAYVVQNPVRARLVSEWTAWPHTILELAP